MPFQKGHRGHRKHYTPKVESVCTICGKVELRRPCEVTPFCGADCYHKSRVGIRPKAVTKTCPQCGVEFTDAITQIGTYCSRPCADAATFTDPAERLWKNVAKSDGCWLWTGAVGSDGYAKFWYKGTTTHAHRAAYELTHGAINDPYLLVCHRCDTPLCVRPDHLFLGTNQENTNDMIRKGRNESGDRHWTRRRPDLIPRGERHWTKRR
jgi:hypothetical protein